MPFRIGVLFGAAGAAALLVLRASGLPSDLIAWILVGGVAVVGGCLGGAAALAVEHIRASPIALAKAVLFVGALTLVALVPHSVDAWRAHAFLARADSTQGVVHRTDGRGGKLLWVGYVVHDTVRSIVDGASRATADLEVGDTTIVFFDPLVPTRATVGRPGPDWRSAIIGFIPLWVVVGVLFIGYGGSADLTGVPPPWRLPLRRLRAYLATAAMADLCFALAMLLQPTVDDPRHAIVSDFSDSLVIGTIPSLIYAFLIGGLAALVPQHGLLTSRRAYGVWGGLLGAFGGLFMARVVGLLAGLVIGTLVGVAFRALYFWGSTEEPGAERGWRGE